jgi:hypothetical protein
LLARIVDVDAPAPGWWVAKGKKMHNGMLKAADAINTYILAKDGNKPSLMEKAFSRDCELEMSVRTDTISFPSAASGTEEITQVLVTKFGDQYENVRTFCLSAPDLDFVPQFSCGWLVGMSSRQDGAVRVGCGMYDWLFDRVDGRVKKLSIDILAMSILPADKLEEVMHWQAHLPYPWCTRTQALKGLPAIDGLAEIANFLKQEKRG